MVLVHFAEKAAQAPFTISVSSAIALFLLRSGRPFETD